MNPITAPPIFSGYDPINKPVTDWLKNLNRWFIIHNIPLERKRPIMETCLEEPANQDYQDAIADGGDLHDDIMAEAGGPLEIAQIRTDNWNSIVTWFNNTFHGLEQQRILRANLPNLFQTLQESPRQFLIRIEMELRKAGFQQAIIQDLSEQSWIHGIHKEVKKHTDGLAHLDFNDLVKASEGYWRSITSSNTYQEEPQYQNRDLRLKPAQFQYKPRYNQNQTEETYEPRQILQRSNSRRPRQQQIQQQEDPAVAELRDMFQDLKVNLANMQKQYQGPGPRVERFYPRTERSNQPRNRRDQLDPQDRYYRDQQQSNQRQNFQPSRDYQQREFTCYRCGEKGHMAKECQSETSRRAQPTQNNRVNTINTYSETSEEEEFNYYASEDEELDQVFPVHTEKKSAIRKPYTRSQEKKPKKTRSPFEEAIEDSEVPLPENPTHSESMAEEKLKTRRTKRYTANTWEKIKALDAGLTIEELVEISPAAREQLKRGISETKPSFKVINAVDEQRTPAYATGMIQNKPTSCIIDTGAGISLISMNMLNRLEWGIDHASKRTLVVADGSKSIALGEMKEVPVTFNNTTIPVDMTVTESTTYDVILGNDWLSKAHAKIDFNAAQLRITHHGKTELINLDLSRGIREQMSETESETEEEGIYNVNSKKWPKATKPPKNSDEDEPTPAQRRREDLRTKDFEDILEEMEKTLGSKPKNPWLTQRPLTKQKWWDQNLTDITPKEQEVYQSWDNNNINWENESTDSEWTKPIRRPITISRDKTSMSLHEKNFKKGVCKHGIHFYSPSDECTWCRIAQETANLAQEEHSPEEPPASQRSPPSESAFLQEIKPIIKIKRMNSTVIIPEIKTEGSIGFDLQAQESHKIHPKDSQLITTGIAITPPPGYFAKVESRSSFAMNGFIVVGGIIDPDYTGEIKVILKNLSEFQTANIKREDRIAQIILYKACTGRIKEVQELQQTHRGNRGFGSTRVNAVKKEMDLSRKEDQSSKSDYTFGKQLTQAQKRELQNLIDQNQDLFAVSFEDIKSAKVKTRHEINTGDSPPIKKAPYKLPPHHRQWVAEEIDKMLYSGIIRESNSPWSTPVILVNKKDGAGNIVPRMCVDYRPLNKVTKKDAFPLPLIADILEGMPPAVNCFTLIDLFMGYNQIPMSEEAREKAAFVTQDGHYEYNHMPFGPTNAPATFQHAMNEMFKGLIGKGVYVYIDDVTIYSQSFKEHMALLREVFKRLRQFQFKMKPKKCTFAADQVEVLGHVINQQGIKPAPSKIEAVKNYPVPQDKADLRAFLGLIGYYRNYIKGCSRISEPLSKMLKKDSRFTWDKEAQATFNRIKNILTSDQILIRPDFQKPFILQTDGSAKGLGAVLSQLDSEGKEHPIAYASQRTTATEANYAASQLEMLAVVWAVKKFHHYLIGKPFKLVTDHSALKQMINTPNPSALFARWIMRLLPYQIDVVIKPGRLHQNADALSRGPVKTPHFIETLPKKGPFLRKEEKRRHLWQ
jgi:deoxyuridine 5'-triphosphate nucleotidohydrolase